MSDRFVLHTSQDDIEQSFEVSTERDDYFEPDYNIIPGRLVPGVYSDENERKVIQFQWGLIPEGADSADEGRKHYQVGVEEVMENDRLKNCFEQRRCLIPANGFYKWKSSKKETTPFYIRLLSNRVMAFGGVYSIWESDSGRDVYSFCMLTTEANTLVKPVDNRMPLIVRREYYNRWLGEDPVGMDNLIRLIEPYRLTDMAVNRVSKKVNDITNNGPDLIQPIPK